VREDRLDLILFLG